uniref:Uncharacterized protein n=1 Tax=uncultured bacterium BAC10G6 TaxID=1329522 RepID=R4JBJ9_9BACT|nr:hypothetical protein metaSSY_00390 [uncultured bacterium BAC10G6]
MAVFGHIKTANIQPIFLDNYLPLLTLQRIAHVSISPYRHIDRYPKY